METLTFSSNTKSRIIYEELPLSENILETSWLTDMVEMSDVLAMDPQQLKRNPSSSRSAAPETPTLRQPDIQPVDIRSIRGPNQPADKCRTNMTAGYSPPNQNLLPRNHVIGSRARYEIQALDSALLGQGQMRREDSEKNIFSGLFKRERRPSDKHKEFVDMLQFPKGNK